jgi:hypothetical protein
MQGIFPTRPGNIMRLNIIILIIIIVLLTLLIINIIFIFQLFVYSYSINISSCCSHTAYHRGSRVIITLIFCVLILFIFGH